MMQPKRIILSILVVLLLTFCTLTAFAETQETPALDIVVSASSDAAIVGVENSFGVEADSVVDFKISVGTWSASVGSAELTVEYDPACLELTEDGIKLAAPYELGVNAQISNPKEGKFIISYLCFLAGNKFSGEMASFSFKVKDMHGDATVKVTPLVAEPNTGKQIPVNLTGGISTVGVHDYAAADSVAPTCTEQGYIYRACTIDGCQDMIILQYVDALGHDNTGAPATCTTHQYCARGCGEILQMKLGHDRTGAAPTCTTDKVCARGCGAVISPKLGHDESGADATCTTDKVCARKGCKAVLVARLGHDEDGPDATCTTDKVCDRYGCNAVLVSKLGHDESAPACGDNRICSRCNRKIPATAEHQFGEWAVEVEATMSAEGVEARTCSVCGGKETQPIPEKSSAWLIILIIALVLVLGGGGFAAYWFLVKKKATTESEETTEEVSEEKTEEATEEATEAPAEEATEEAAEEKTEE